MNSRTSLRPASFPFAPLAGSVIALLALASGSSLFAQSNFATPYIITTFAGSPQIVGSTDDIARGARFKSPQGVARDSNGNLYVADDGNDTIRKITPSGVVTTLAGSAGLTGVSDGTGSVARFNSPRGICVDKNGVVFVADTFNNTIRKITVNGAVTTLAGAGPAGHADGTGAAATFSNPIGICVDTNDNLYVADEYNQKIRKITSDGVVTTFAGSGVQGFTNATGTAASFDYPFYMAIDSSGDLFVTDSNNNAIREITSDAAVTTFAGGVAGDQDGTGTAAKFSVPAGMAFDGNGNTRRQVVRRA